MRRTLSVAIAIGFAVLAVVYVIALRAPAVGLFHDDGIYVVTAKALASGQGYNIVSLPEPVPQTKYPILFPALLAVVWKVLPAFPANVLALKLVPFLGALVWFVLSFRLLWEEEVPPRAAGLAVMLTAASGGVFILSTSLLSETVFAALCFGSLLLLRRIDRPSAALWLVCGTGIAIGLAMLTRTTGVALLAAGVLVLVHKRCFRNALVLTFVVALVYAPWLLWTSAHPVSGHSVEAYYTAENYRSWNIIFGFSPQEKWIIAANNVLYLSAAPLVLLSLPLSLVPCVAGAAIFAYGAARDVVSRRSLVLYVFLACYFGLLALWAWPPYRFVTPVFPLVLLVFWRATEKVRVIPWVRWALGAAVFCVLIRQGGDLYDSFRNLWLYGAHPPDDWVATRGLTDWVRTSTPPDAVFLSSMDPLMYLYAGRKANRGYYANPAALFYGVATSRNPVAEPSDLVRQIIACKATYLTLTPDKGFAEHVPLRAAVTELIRSRPAAFRRVYHEREYEVYEIDRRALMAE